MAKRFVVIWFRYLRTDWFALRRPDLCKVPLALALPDHGRMIVTAVNIPAQEQGINNGMVVADARAIIPALHVMDDKPGLTLKLLKSLAEWCIRYTPVVAIDMPDGLILDVTGCAHLWKGESQYLMEIISRLSSLGYYIKVAMADTIGCAWAVARFGQEHGIIKSGEHAAALLPLPPQALRLEQDAADRLHKLGLRQIKDFMGMPRPALRRRFGRQLLCNLDRALGLEEELIEPVLPVQPYQERLPCPEPIVTATGIEIALQRLLEALCHRLTLEGKGVRLARFKAFRIDGKIEQVEVGTVRPSYNPGHLFKLFDIRLPAIEPGMGIELFCLEAMKVEDHGPLQEKLWESIGGLEDTRLSELLDRLEGRLGAGSIHRYVPDEHHWPERSFKEASSLDEKPGTAWKISPLRPLQVLAKPEAIQVTAPIPDYPPMLFRYRGKLHKVVKADGPERIEQEWWLQEGQHRDYYCVEDEDGRRYWLFRSGHYDAALSYKWFIHGFFS